MGLLMGPFTRRFISHYDIMDFSTRKLFFFVILTLAGLSLIEECRAAPPASAAKATLDGYPVLIPLLDENEEPDYIVRYIPDLRKILSLSPERNSSCHRREESTLALAVDIQALRRPGICWDFSRRALPVDRANVRLTRPASDVVFQIT